MDCRDCSNKRCYLNTNCLSSWLEYVETFKTRKLISAGMKVFTEGDLVTGIYVICSGKLKITMKTGTSRESIIRLAADGQVLGHRGISKNMIYPISAETLEDSELAFIPNEVFFKLLKHNVDLSTFMMMFFADELMRSEQKFRMHALASETMKVASALCMVVDAFGYVNDTQQIDSPMSFSDLSNFAEVSKNVFLKAINNLSDSKIIKINKNKVTVLDEPALRKMAYPVTAAFTAS